jgi:hypothetical protein
MKLSSIPYASIVALTAFAMSADAAFAGANDPITGVGVVLGHKPPSAVAIAPHTTKPCLGDKQPCGQPSMAVKGPGVPASTTTTTAPATTTPTIVKETDQATPQ